MRLKERNIYFFEVRTFGAMYSTALQYVRQNFGSFGKLLLFTSGPIMLIAIFAANWFENEVGSVHLGLPAYNEFTSWWMDWLVTGLIVFSILYLGRVFMMSAVAAQLITTEETGTKEYDSALVYQLIRKNILNIVAVALLLIAIGWVLILPTGYLIHLLGNYDDDLATFIAFILGCGVIVLYFPLSYAASSVIFIIFKERLGPFKALRRALFRLKDIYWNSWVVFFVASGAMLVIWALLLIPSSVGEMIYGLVVTEEIAGFEQNPWPIVVVGMMARLSFNLFWGYYYLLCGFNYYTAIERQTGKGLKKRIEDLGSGVSYRDVEPGY